MGLAAADTAEGTAPGSEATLSTSAQNQASLRQVLSKEIPYKGLCSTCKATAEETRPPLIADSIGVIIITVPPSAAKIQTTTFSKTS